MPEKRDPWAGNTVIMPAPESAPFELEKARPQLFDHAHNTLQAAAPAAPDERAPSAGRIDDFGSVTVFAPAPSLDLVPAFSGSALQAPKVAPRATADFAPLAGAVAPQGSAARHAPPRMLGATLAAIRARVSDEFRRTPRSMRLALFALPMVAYAALHFGHEAETLSPTATAIATPGLTNTRVTPPPTAAPPSTQAASEFAELPVNPGIVVGKRTLQARAADAAARGAFNEAIPLYEELARLNPTHAEFATATRILRAKRGSL